MDNVIFDYYTGFEGEGEIQFIEILDGDYKNIIRIWDGYFDDIMEKIEPDSKGWTSLAYYYNLAEGWYDESPWKIPNLNDALNQISQVENADFRFDKTKDVENKICNLLKHAINNGNHIYIARE